MDGDGPGVLDLIERWSGLGVVAARDRPTDAWMFVALHDDTLGRPMGGCRMRVYGSVEEGLTDALRLAEGMTSKWAVIDFPFGGGKSVIALSRPLAEGERAALLLRFAELLNTLNGAFQTGEDMGTTPEDMHRMAAITPYVTGAHPITGEPLDPGPYTALGVLAGIRAALEAVTGSASLARRSVLIQGVGDVGEPLARMVADAGGHVLVADVLRERADAVARACGGHAVDPAAVHETACDVYAPCAIGATLNHTTVPILRCRIVAGSANNQLEVPDDAARLEDRRVLYAPDYVVNAGGAMAVGLMAAGLTDPGELRRRVGTLRSILAQIFEEARDRGESPVVAASRRVERTLARGRAEKTARRTALAS